MRWKCHRCNGPCILDDYHILDSFTPFKCPYGYNASWVKVVDSEAPTDDPVNHPSHYTAGKYETIEVIEDWGLDFCLGNAVKYISRAGKKDPSKEVEDLNKAVWYVNRRIKQLEERK